MKDERDFRDYLDDMLAAADKVAVVWRTAIEDDPAIARALRTAIG